MAKFFSKKLHKFLVIAGICFLLIFLNFGGIFNPVRSVLFKIAYPFQKTFYMLSQRTSLSLEFLGSISNLKKENENLIKENDSLYRQLASLSSIKQENEMLRDQLNLAPAKKYDLAASFVIGQNPEGQGSWLMIDKGSDQGIKPHMPVIVSDGILVGRVEESSAGSSKITLLTDSSSAVNVEDLETGARGILKGQYGLGIIMDMSTQSDILNQGDTIITSGLGGSLPRGLVVGKIQEVRPSEDKLFQQSIIIPRVKYLKLNMIFVIKN